MSSETSPARGLAFPLILSVIAIPAGPILLTLGLLAQHALAYRGLCGPYPTDIPAFSCGFGEYLVNFFEPFALAGLLALSVLAIVVTLALVAAAWMIGGTAWALASALRARRAAR